MISPEPTTAPASKPTANQVALGLFILWQLVFLVVANVVEFFPHRPPGRDEMIDFPEPLAGMQSRRRPILHAVASVTDRWAELTGQYQVWWLFAPRFPLQAAFPLVELRWDDEPPGSPAKEGLSTHAPVRLPSDYEPMDVNRYFRPPGSSDRMFHYEVRLGLVLLLWDDRDARAEAGPWWLFRRDRARRQWKSIRAYLRYRLEQFQRERPETPPPEQAILMLRLYRTPPPDAQLWKPEGPFEQPVARWRPGMKDPAASLPITWYDPFARRFKDLPRLE